MKHKKEKCKSKYEDDKLRKKDKKKHKKRKKYDTSNSSDNDSAVEQEWVEKSVIETDRINQDVPTSTRKEEPCKREEWMTVNSIFPCVFNDKKPSSASSDKQTSKCDLDKLGQSDKELNPYWKEGGNGLPSVDSTSTNRGPIMDVNWLKKSLRRAHEEAEREGKSIEEIAAQRWGSLEVIQSMISKAENMCSRDKYKKQYDRRDNEKYKLENHAKSERYRTSGECSNHSVNSKRDYHRSRRHRSRSGSSDRNEQHSTRNNAQYEKRKQTYKRPVEGDYSVSTSYNARSSTTKRWQKATELDKVKDTRSNVSESKTVSIELNSNVNNISGNKEMNAVPETDLNKLGAKIVKAEIMGDTKLVAELKLQLKEARELATNAVRLNESEKDQIVTLTRTDSKGVTRPLEHRNQSTDSSRNTKRKTAQTHTAGKRTLHYFDDDKYSLQELFQREKGRSANEDDAAFTKVASRSMNMDEIFEEQITRVQDSSKRDEKDRSLAIKEHKRLSKSLDTCHWCIDSKYMLKHMIVAMDSEICLSLPAYTSLTEGHCIITPVQHIACQLQLDENIRRFSPIVVILEIQMDIAKKKQPQNRGRPRDYEGMRSFNERKNSEKGFSWADDVEIEEKAEAASSQGKRVTPSRQNHNRNRADSWKTRPAQPKPPKVGDAARAISSVSIRGRTEVPPVSDDVYPVGTIGPFVPITQSFGHNLDFSTFPLLVERTYRDLLSVDERLGRKLPRCAFEHYCT